MIMQTEIAGPARSGKTFNLLALYREFDEKGMNPVFVAPTADIASSYKRSYKVRAISARQMNNHIGSRAFLIDDIDSFPRDGDLLELAKHRLATHAGVCAIVSARTIYP